MLRLIKLLCFKIVKNVYIICLTISTFVNFHGKKKKIERKKNQHVDPNLKH